MADYTGREIYMPKGSSENVYDHFGFELALEDALVAEEFGIDPNCANPHSAIAERDRLLGIAIKLEDKKRSKIISIIN